MRIPQQDTIQIPTPEFKQFPIRVEDDYCDVCTTEDSQFVSFFEESVLAFQERYLSVPIVRDGGDRDFTSTHRKELYFEALMGALRGGDGRGRERERERERTGCRKARLSLDESPTPWLCAELGGRLRDLGLPRCWESRSREREGGNERIGVEEGRGERTRTSYCRGRVLDFSNVGRVRGGRGRRTRGRERWGRETGRMRVRVGLSGRRVSSTGGIERVGCEKRRLYAIRIESRTNMWDAAMK